VSRGFGGEPLALGASPVAISGDGHVAAFQTSSPELAGSIADLFQRVVAIPTRYWTSHE
jgi:hypothetical protein